MLPVVLVVLHVVHRPNHLVMKWTLIKHTHTHTHGKEDVLSTCKIGGSFRSLVFNKAFSYTLLELFSSVSFSLFIRRRGLDRELALQHA